MNRNTSIVLSSVVFLGLGGCASDFEESYREPSQFELGRAGDVLTMTADQRSILVRPKAEPPIIDPESRRPIDGGRTVFCAEPVPDTALASMAKITAGLTAKAGAIGGVTNPELTANTASELTTTITQLAGRNSTVLLTRDLMYRLCELSANYRPGSVEYEQASKNFNEVIKAVVLLAKADATVADTENKLARARSNALSDDRWRTISDGTIPKAAKINLILSKVADNGKINGPKANDLIAKAEAEKLSADGKKKLSAATGDLADFGDVLLFLPDTDIDALWKAAQK